MYKLDEPATLINAGLITGISNEYYHASLGVSKSQLDQLAKSPAHYLDSLKTPRKETPAMRLGTLFHGLILEPERIKIAPAPVCDKRTKEGKAVWERFCLENQGAEVVTAEEAEQLAGMVQAVRRHPAAFRLLYSCNGVAEGSAWWIDRQSGELCRCRPDYLRDDGVIVDLKTTEDASPEAFSRSIAKYGYHRQAAMYLDGLDAATGNRPSGFVFVCVEKKSPYAVSVYQLDMQGEEAGRVQYRSLLMTLADCKCSGKWPAYSDRIETISLPSWSAKEILCEYE